LATETHAGGRPRPLAGWVKRSLRKPGPPVPSLGQSGDMGRVRLGCVGEERWSAYGLGLSTRSPVLTRLSNDYVALPIELITLRLGGFVPAHRHHTKLRLSRLHLNWFRSHVGQTATLSPQFGSLLSVCRRVDILRRGIQCPQYSKK